MRNVSTRDQLNSTVYNHNAEEEEEEEGLSMVVREYLTI